MNKERYVPIYPNDRDFWLSFANNGDTAAKLLIGLLDYSNDESRQIPAIITENNLESLFILYKKKVDFVLEKYDGRKITSAVNGSKGGRPRKQPVIVDEPLEAIDENYNKDVAYLETKGGYLKFKQYFGTLENMLEQQGDNLAKKTNIANVKKYWAECEAANA